METRRNGRTDSCCWSRGRRRRGDAGQPSATALLLLPLLLLLRWSAECDAMAEEAAPAACVALASSLAVHAATRIVVPSAAA